MFDFENTPIYEYTKLKANYQCEAPSLLTYYGDWARVTLNNGTVLEVQSESELNTFLTSYSSAVDGQNITAYDVVKVEFGTKVTSIPNSSLQKDKFGYLTNISGFHEGLKTIGSNFLSDPNCNKAVPVSNFTLVFPSTLTSVNSGLLNCNSNFTGSLIINAPATVFNTIGVALVADGDALAYTNGIKIGGVYANDFITRFPNQNGPNDYRNLYNGNTLTSFFEALEDGSAQEIMPPGTLIPDLYNGNTPFNWRVLHYGQATGSDDTSIYGVYLQALVNVGHAGMSVADYGISTLNIGLNELVSNFSETVRDKISELKVPYYYNGTNKTAVAKLWLPSVVEIYGANQNVTGYEGFPFDYFKNASGWTAGSNNANNVRVQPPSNALSWGTRSWASGSNMYFVTTNGSIESIAYSATTKYCLPCAFLPARIKVEVSFNANGGTPEPPIQKVIIGNYATKPDPDPQKEGSEFVGWFLPGQTYDFVGEIPVMFRMNGGTPQVPTQYVKSGEYAEQPTETPELEGYEFIGWYKAGEVPEDWDGVNVI